MKTKKGFTIVELMVVMSIMALMAILGISALVNTNNAAILDKGTEAVLSQLREAQNRSFAVAESPTEPDVFPVAWGIKIITNSAVNPEDSILPFYIKEKDGGGYEFEVLPAENVFEEAGFLNTVVSFVSGGAFPENGNIYILYSAPFGKFYATTEDIEENCFSGICEKENVRPYSFYLDSGNIKDQINLDFEYRRLKSKILILENGEVYIAG